MRKAIAIDFDGCLCENKWPDIGEPNWPVINQAKAEQQAGAGLILWTCRAGERLADAVQFCKSCGLEFDAVNDNLPERTAAYGANPRKVNADEYWDDKAVRMPVSDPMLDQPLALDELREVDGEPLWIVEPATGLSYWVIARAAEKGVDIIRFEDTDDLGAYSV